MASGNAPPVHPGPKRQPQPQKFKSRNIPGMWAGGQMTLHPRSDRPSWSSTRHDLHCFVFFLFDASEPYSGPKYSNIVQADVGPKTAMHRHKWAKARAERCSTLLHPSPPRSAHTPSRTLLPHVYSPAPLTQRSPSSSSICTGWRCSGSPFVRTHRITSKHVGV